MMTSLVTVVAGFLFAIYVFSGRLDVSFNFQAFGSGVLNPPAIFLPRVPESLRAF